MRKTNGCLVAHMCLHEFFGDGLCEHTCDTDYVDNLKEEVFSRIANVLFNGLPAYLQRRLVAHLAGVYFAERNIDDE